MDNDIIKNDEDINTNVDNSAEDIDNNVDNSLDSDENENIRPVKEKSRQRIDGAVSLIDAYCIFVDKQNEYLNFIGEGVGNEE